MARASLWLFYFKVLNRNGGLEWFDVLKKKIPWQPKSRFRKLGKVSGVKNEFKGQLGVFAA